MSNQNTFLPSPRSYLTLPSLPSLPSSILSPPLPTSRSTPSFQSHHSFESHPQHHRPFSPADRINSSFPQQAVPFAPQSQEEDDSDSFLLHTASVLVLSTLEQKGHSWLAARKSSTSLTLSPPTSPKVSGGDYFPPNAVHSRPYSHRSSAISTPRALRSRHHSRRSSTSKLAPTTYPAADFVQREPLLQHERDFDMNDVRNEKAAAINAESEVRNLLMVRMGGWLEWAVGWMDFRDGDGDGDGDDDDEHGDYEVNERSTAGIRKSLSAIGSGVNENEDHHIRRGIDFRELMEAPKATMNIKNKESTPIKIQSKTTTAGSENKLDIEDRDVDETESGGGAVPDQDTPLPSPAYPRVSSPLETVAEVRPEARAGNWAGVHDVWWGDAKWLFEVAGRVAW